MNTLLAGERYFSMKREIAKSKDFIRLFGAILRLKNILTAFDDFAGNEILTEREYQDYQSTYIDLYQDFTRGKDADKEDINDASGGSR